MPIYEYEVKGTGARFEVMHPARLEVLTWRELKQFLGDSQDTYEDDLPVEKIISGRIFVNGNLEDLSKGKVIQRNSPPKRKT